MSIEKLQEKIRKTKNPAVFDLTVYDEQIPVELLKREEDVSKARDIYCRDLLEALKGIFPAVRFSYSYYALLGAGETEKLLGLMTEAKRLGYYVLLDGIDTTTPFASKFAAERMADFPCDGFVVSPYAGADALDPFVKRLKDSGRTLFAIIRSPNKSAAQMQDLMTGSRLAHVAAADMVNHVGVGLISRNGYSQIGAVAAANAPDSLRLLRSKYPKMFLLVDGYDYNNANAKHCSMAFDQLGRGAAVCAGSSILTAWEDSAEEYTVCAVRIAERMRKNLAKYVSVL